MRGKGTASALRSSLWSTFHIKGVVSTSVFISPFDVQLIASKRFWLWVEAKDITLPAPPFILYDFLKYVGQKITNYTFTFY